MTNTCSSDQEQAIASNSADKGNLALALPPVPQGLRLVHVFYRRARLSQEEIAEKLRDSETGYGVEESLSVVLASSCADPGAKPALLIVDTPESVEDAREAAIAAISIPDSKKDSVAFVEKLAATFKKESLGCFVYLGWDNADVIEQGCARAKLPCVTLDPLKLHPLLPEKAGMAQILQEVDASEFSGKVNKLLHQAALEEGEEGGKLSLDAAAKKARRILIAPNASELSINLELEKVREACGMGSYDWDKKIIRPLRKELEKDRFKLELLALLQIDDPVEFIRQKAALAPKYQMPLSSIDKALAAMKQRTSTPEVKAYDIKDFLELETEGLTWLIPEMLPKGETVILSAPPKGGKTILATDVAFAVVTGESTFLGEPTKQGKVLIVQTDGSLQSTRAQLLKRGFRKHDTEKIRILPRWNISQMALLEKELEDFRPSLVIIDSLRRINHGSEISENSAEFADNIYTLKEKLGQYGASGILIHHDSKSSDLQGVYKLRGTGAISGAVWGVWQLDRISKPDPKRKGKFIVDQTDPNRTFSFTTRDSEEQHLHIELNLENNSWIKHAKPDEAEKESLKNRILAVMKQNSNSPGFKGIEIIELLGMNKEEGRKVYSALNRMANKHLISAKPAPGDKRYQLYSLPENTPQDSLPPPPPPECVPNTDYSSETLTTNELDNTQQITQQLLSNYSATSQEKKPSEYSNAHTASDSETLSNSSEKRGEGVVEVKNTQQVLSSSEATESEWDTDESMNETASTVIEELNNSTQLSQGSQQEVPDPWGIEEVESTRFGFEIYDTVAGSGPYNANYAMHGCVQDVRPGEVLVRWVEREGKPGLPEEWYSVDELRLIQRDELL